MTMDTEKLWRDFNQKLEGFIIKRINDAEDARDILQEVYLKIHSYAEKISGLRNTENWLYSITSNTIIDYYRTRKNKKQLPEELSAMPELDSGDVKKQLAPAIRSMIDTLPNPYREALIFTEYQGMTQSGLAQKMGISLSGAKSRVQRARKMLRDIMDECCHYELDRFGCVIDYQPKCQYCFHHIPRPKK
ncbi:MAG: RNA polymerase sigma factor SigZ [Calditrichia bacterium]